MIENLILLDEEATDNLAREIAGRVDPPLLIALWGDLGAGKTSFARGFIRALTGSPTLEVPSPTFTLVQSYEARKAVIWHFDLYRLKRADEAAELGLYEALSDGIVLIEWPERLGAMLPKRRLDIRLKLTDDGKGRVAEIDDLQD